MGIKVTLTEQVLLGATVAPVHMSSLVEKSLAFVPAMAALEIIKLAVPVLVTVTVWAALVVLKVWSGKSMTLGERFTAGVPTVEVTPVPVRPTVCGLPAALSVIVIKPVLVPVAVGVNVTLIMQLLPPGIPPPQVFVCAKSPLATMLPMLRGALPTLRSVTVCGEVVMPTVWLAKLRLAGVRLTPGTSARLIFATKAS
jgi:hypothetical protein